ncbi:MAG TPA: response regulator [Epulopiscium sp.]|nr:response regulator [Candidatus Epulonipiscium sp.]
MVKAAVTLLIADDEDHIRNGIKTYIALNSKVIDKIYTASDGAEALDKIFKYKPDIMLIDVQMPYKNGLTVMKEANEAGVCPKTIILSGYDDFAYAQQAIRHGALDYLLKPCRSTDILMKVERLAKTNDAGDVGILSLGEEKEEKQGNQIVSMAVEYINEHYMESLSLTKVAEEVGVTPGYLTTLFAQTIGDGFVDYLNKIRVDRACNYLHDGQLKIYEVAYKVGFKDEKYFTRVFKKITKVSPSQFRKKI